ncbi:asparagine synthase-related protein [Streptomyces albidoflavus]|uniref:asparagine synthase-related protein n=1 Tax=Streptomyces albidoflavus TaxID=1886 RepID=UPI003D14E791
MAAACALSAPHLRGCPEHARHEAYDLATAWRPLVMTSDKLASAFVLERRSPFLARDLVEFSYRLPVEHKIGEQAAGKRILRDAAKALGLPREVWDSRNKLGFASPVPSWLSGPLEPWATTRISPALDQAPRSPRPLLAGGLKPGGRFDRARIQSLMAAAWFNDHPAETAA